MINFIYGRAGSGKTSLICEKAAEAVAAGRRVFMIVPEQMAVDTEERMTRLLGNTPSLSLEILNFRRLCNRIFRQYGGLSYSYITKSGRMLMMWRTLSELAPLLKNAPSVERASVSQMLGAISEFKAYNITPRALERAAKSIENEQIHKKLSDKLYDLSLICASYTNLVSETCDDASDDLTKAADILRENDFFTGADVFFDSFYGFTPQEYEVVKQVFEQSESSTVSLCLDALPKTANNELFENQRATAEYLMELAKNTGNKITKTVLSENRRAKSDELKFLESSLWSLDLTSDDAYPEDAPAISFIECTSPFSECEAVATDILRRVREGAKWRDFAVVSRGIDRYDGILDTAFQKYGIPLFVSRRTDIKTKPLIKLILSALNLRSGNFKCEDVISYMKTGLCGITPDEISVLENYATAWRIRGAARWNEDFTMNPGGYTSIFTEEAAQKLDRVNSIRERIITQLTDFHTTLDKAETVRDFSKALYDFLAVLEVPKKLAEIAESCRTSDPAAAQENEQLWSIFVDALDELCTVMPDMSTDSAEYCELLKIIFDETDIGRIPNSVDEVVSGDASLLRASGKHVYILGANEGIFPLAPSDDGIFLSAEREQLAALGVDLAGGCDSQAADERFFFYRALTSASDSVTVIWSSSDLSGHSMKPSFGVTRLRALFPNVKVTDFAAADIFSRLEGRTNLLEFIAEADGTPLGDALRKYAEADSELSSRLDKLSIPLCDDSERLSEDTCQKISGGNLALTQSRLETYVLCHFSYFLKHIIKLDENKPAKFSASDIGTFVHHILESFVSRAEKSGTLANITDAEIDDMVEQIVADYMQTICRITPDFTGSRLAHLFAKLKKSSRLLCKNLADEFRQSRFRPAFFELPIKFPSPDEETVEPLSVKLEDGTYAYLYGIADRVDIMEHEDKCYIRVIDYKTGVKDFSLEDVSMGLDLQMLLYLFSIWKNGNSPRSALKISENSEIIPAGVLYFSAGVPTVTLDAEASEEEVEKMASDKLSRKGLLLEDAEVLKAMENELSGHYLPVKIKKDGNFSSTDSLTSLDGFRTLLSSIENTIENIGNEIKRGNASANPMQSQKRDACKYCAMRPVCRKPAKKGGK